MSDESIAKDLLNELSVRDDKLAAELKPQVKMLAEKFKVSREELPALFKKFASKTSVKDLEQYKAWLLENKDLLMVAHALEGSYKRSTTNIVIIHGTEGSPEVNWFPWLKQRLENNGWRVSVPSFPTPDGQSLENWLRVLHEQELTENTILIGHSMGPALILRELEQRSTPIKAAFLVSGFTRTLGNEHFDPLIKSFVEKPFNWEKIKDNCRKFYVFHGDNDPYVPVSESEKIAKNLSVDLELIKNGGHLNSESGYDEFIELDMKLSEVL